jgi:hypothetical protein
MASDVVKLSIPFTSLIAAISELDPQDKHRLLEMLEEELADIEQTAWEQNPALQVELQQARAEFDAGDFVSIETYIDQAGEKT